MRRLGEKKGSQEAKQVFDGPKTKSRYRLML
jgi:hypothetical protein